MILALAAAVAPPSAANAGSVSDNVDTRAMVKPNACHSVLEEDLGFRPLLNVRASVGDKEENPFALPATANRAKNDLI